MQIDEYFKAHLQNKAVLLSNAKTLIFFGSLKDNNSFKKSFLCFYRQFKKKSIAFLKMSHRLKY